MHLYQHTDLGLGQSLVGLPRILLYCSRQAGYLFVLRDCLQSRVARFPLRWLLNGCGPASTGACPERLHWVERLLSVVQVICHPHSPMPEFALLWVCDDLSDGQNFAVCPGCQWPIALWRE